MLSAIWTMRFRQLNDQSLSVCHWYAQERNSIDPTGIEYKSTHRRPGYKRAQD